MIRCPIGRALCATADVPGRDVPSGDVSLDDRSGRGVRRVIDVHVRLAAGGERRQGLGAVLRRMMRLPGMTGGLGGTRYSRPVICARRISTQRQPKAVKFWRIVVSGGVRKAA